MANNIIFLVDEYLQQPNPAVTGFANLLAFNLNDNRIKGNSSYISVSTGAVSNIVQLTGTVKGLTSSNTIVGQSSIFDLELSPGDRIRVTGFTNNTVVRVHSITGAQTMIVTPRPPVSFSTAANVYIRKLEIKAPERFKIGANGHTIALKSLTVAKNLKVVGNTSIGSSAAEAQVTISHATAPTLYISETSTTGAPVLWLKQYGTTGEGLKVTYDSASGHSYINNVYSGGSLFLQTVSTTRLAIDSSGRVTEPYQPYAAGSCSSAYTLTAGGFVNGFDVIYGNVDINVGNHYNSTTGKFTAPVAGAYLVMYTILITAGAPNSIDYRLSLSINNGQTMTGSTLKPFNAYPTVYISNIVYLNANDTVKARFWNDSGSGTSHGDPNYQRFSIMLLG
jgi:hypothetical protein